MSRNMSKEPNGEPTPRDPRALLSAGALLATVAVVLVLGAVLHGRVPTPTGEPADVPTPVVATDVVREAEGDLPPVSEDVEPAQDTSLQARAGRDRARLAGEGQRWTLQLVVACREEGVLRLLAEAPGEDQLFVLPREVGGRTCWAVTWGTFASQADAMAATPPFRLSLTDPPRPRPFTAYLS
jgi:septal ring-binding cell division protein DamX